MPWCRLGSAVAGAALTFTGFMHSEELGFGRSPQIAAGYLAIALALVAFQYLPVADDTAAVSAPDWADSDGTPPAVKGNPTNSGHNPTTP